MTANKYPEEFKIELIRRYFNGEKRNELCKKYSIAKSTFWGRMCKYSSLVYKKFEFEIKSEVSEDLAFVDIRRKCEDTIKSTIIHQNDDIIRIFVNGYAILCTNKTFKYVIEVLNND